MKNIQLLDCSLREAPLNELMWGEMSIRKMIHGMEKANIDIIEVGFLKNVAYKEGSSSFNHVEDIEPYLKNKKSGTFYVALVDYGRYDLSNLSDYNGKSIDAIRVCFKHHEVDLVLNYAKEIRAKGYQVSIQHVDTIGYTDEKIVEFVEKVNEFKPFSYSIVDTFGAMYEDDMLHLARLVDGHLRKDVLFGFHGHNNLMLADANAQRFVQEIGNHRNIIVDSSLYGCGRSAGNAHTELMAQYLVRKHQADYDINELLDLIDTVIAAAQKKTSWGYSIPYFIAGMHNAHTFNVKQLLKRHNLKSKDLRGIIEKLDDTQKKAYDYKLLEKLYVEYFDRPVEDTECIEELTKYFEGRKILIIAPGRSVLEHKSEIDCFIENNSPIVIGVNNLIEGYKLDYIFYSGAVRYNNIQYQNLKVNGKPKLIITSNIKTIADKNELIVNYSSLIKFGWINLDSSAILLLRLLQKCGVNELYAAGLDGYKPFGKAFYKNELDTGLEDKDRLEQTQDNISMMKDMRLSNQDFMIHFVTESVYASVFQIE